MSETCDVLRRPKTMAWETIVSMYGAALATVLAAIRVYELMRDRAKLKVTARLGMAPILGGEIRDIVVLEAVNVGRRPITLSSGYLELSDGRNLPAVKDLGTPLPCKLSESERCSLYIRLKEVRQAEQEHGEVTALAFRDAAGKVYREKFTLPSA